MYKFKGCLNKITGCPELYIEDSKGNRQVASTNNPNGVIFYPTDEASYMVFSKFYEGRIPSGLLGIALKVTKA